MCKYSDSEWKCPYETLPDSEYCIFHLKDVNKDVEEFNKGINEILESDEGIINFNGFFFPSKTSDFSKKCFHKHVVFKNVVFPIDATFYKAKFLGDAIFVFAEFSGNVYFDSVVFSGKTDFGWAKFLGNASFDLAKFIESADFTVAKFSGNADFDSAEFSDKADFDSAKFSDKANFYWVRFSRKANFIGAEFSRDADFSQAKFLEETIFYKAQFLGKANFIGAVFSGDADFSQAELYGIFHFIPNNSKVIKFNDAFFSDNVRIRANLSQCYFHGSNIEMVDLTDSTWDNDNIKDFRLLYRIYNYFFNSSISILEASQGELALNWKILEGIYRRLKQSYQKSGNYEISGEFYIQEKECKRRQLSFFSRHSWNLFYRGFCLYGERPYNVILASFFTIIIFATSYLFHGVEFTGSELLQISPYYINYDLSLNSFGIQWLITNIYLVSKDFLLCIYTSLITFTTLGYGDVHPVGWSRFFASIESGIGIFMTALFIFVFTRRMIR